MAWNTKPKCLWIVILITMVGSYSVALKCEDHCDGCSTTSIVCYGGINPRLPEIVSMLPQYTECFTFICIENAQIVLDDSHFEHVTHLKILNLTSKNEYRFSGLWIGRSQLNVFAPLAKLQTLRIHLMLQLEYEPVDDLFRPLVHLEELDLSQTMFLNITKLHRALYGLSNSTRLETINLSNVQSDHHDPPYPILNLTWFLEPLQNCPIKHLHLANNGFKGIYPGIIRYTPLLEYIDVSQNRLVKYVLDFPFLQPAFLQEALLHKGLQEIDFSYQSPVTEDQTMATAWLKSQIP